MTATQLKIPRSVGTTVTFFFPESAKMSRTKASFYAYHRGFGVLRSFGHRAPVPMARGREVWKMKQKNYIIRELSVTTYPESEVRHFAKLAQGVVNP